jgi:hypothetical protein
MLQHLQHRRSFLLGHTSICVAVGLGGRAVVNYMGSPTPIRTAQRGLRPGCRRICRSHGCLLCEIVHELGILRSSRQRRQRAHYERRRQMVDAQAHRQTVGQPIERSCTSETFCAAIDEDGSVITFNGSSWSEPQRIDRSGELNSISCASPSFCVATDSNGDVLVDSR